METQVEKSVDPDLDIYLNKELPTNNVRVNVSPGEEFASIDNKLISERTRSQILHHIRRGANLADADELMDLIKKLQTLPHEEGETLLKGLKTITAQGVDHGLVRYLIKELTHIFYNPQDKKRKRCAKNDKFILACGSDALNEIFGTLGWLSGIIVFGIYGVASWRTFDETQSIGGNKKQKREES